jgi:hypothetical protein
MYPGRNMYARRGKAGSAFSVLPLTRAHMRRPRSELPLPATYTWTTTSPAFRALGASAAARVMP